jgi:hypothetical protein
MIFGERRSELKEDEGLAGQIPDGESDTADGADAPL